MTLFKSTTHWSMALAVATGAALATPVLAENVTLNMVLVSPADRWNFILDHAKTDFKKSHPDVNLTVNAQILPYGDRLTRLRAAAVGGSPLDIVSLDEPEVGDFANQGFLTDLTPLINRDMNGLKDWLPAYRDATKFNGKTYAIWAWTDARVLWYWKDLVKKAGVDPVTDMRTWKGYLDSCKKMNGALSGKGIEGCLLIGKPWIADWTLPYVWMNNGDIGQDVSAAAAKKAGAREAWVPTFDTKAWIDALTFTKQQVADGITPFTEHQFGPAFVSRRFATWLGGVWVYGSLASSGADMSNVGLVAAFPTPNKDTPTATMAGGWTLAVPSTSKHQKVAWEFLQTMLSQDVMGAAEVKYGYLPVRKSFATNLNNEFAKFWDKGGSDRWKKLQALAPHAYGRPNFPNWPKVANAITQMVQSVMFNGAAPAKAAADAQKQVLVNVLGWPAGTTVSLVDDQNGTCGENGRLISAVTPVQKSVDANGSGTICSVVKS